jgi:hypothetical protein
MTTCSRCFRPATAYAVGKFINGVEARDPRCERDAPLATDAGCFLFFASYRKGQEREFRFARLEPIKAPR